MTGESQFKEKFVKIRFFGSVSKSIYLKINVDLLYCKWSTALNHKGRLDVREAQKNRLNVEKGVNNKAIL
jgi:hypothetical protein